MEHTKSVLQQRIALIDADLIGRKRHRFPNLVVMKLSAYHKSIGDAVTLKIDYDDLAAYDRVYISKVFTDTPMPDGIQDLPNVQCGGTGFYFDKAPPLPHEIEHIMPDYHAYDDWLSGRLTDKTRTEYKEYTDYSIGFMTRGCFRGCPFCVNQNYKRVIEHSPLSEFYDPSRKKICLLDDNFLGCPNWEKLLTELIDTGKRFKFKQGLDERLLTPHKCELLFSAKYDGSYTFAFDNIADEELITSKLNLIREHTDTDNLMFYVLTAFDRNGQYDMAFWRQDILDLLKRIFILGRYHALPYVMRFEKYRGSPFYGAYVTIASWCNRISTFKKKTLRQYVDDEAARNRRAPERYMGYALSEIPELKNYYDTLAWRNNT